MSNRCPIGGDNALVLNPVGNHPAGRQLASRQDTEPGCAGIPRCSRCLHRDLALVSPAMAPAMTPRHLRIREAPTLVLHGISTPSLSRYLLGKPIGRRRNRFGGKTTSRYGNRRRTSAGPVSDLLLASRYSLRQSTLEGLAPFHVEHIGNRISS